MFIVIEEGAPPPIAQQAAPNFMKANLGLPEAAVEDFVVIGRIDQIAAAILSRLDLNTAEQYI